MPLRDRANHVYELMAALRLVDARLDVRAAADAALGVEDGVFRAAGEKMEYERDCAEELDRLRDVYRGM
ncbi:hypothetical protein BO78DRAFT_421101 [Aspergillus sclerotiicarbonarius CBS 121057]|uniref:Uncharacterized protein n=1 Tax=Aspergillus sclerotiicarbonarius (strain CBS 121057 / IBT 28362) TaxID=1448318 RepID=A0A319E3P7_ASPSB|nr:hypothetical protein BO78DRAFT_421101 [Aspergillus sclerotiicarbonarius CBS 121057]